MSSSSKTRSNKSSSSGSSFSMILGFSKSLEKSAFGVLYAMIKGNTFPKFLTIISLIIEFIQFVSFGFKKRFPWGGETGYYLKRIVSPVNHPANVLQYTGFTILFWVAVGLMILGFINIWYVAYKFYQGKIANIWIIRTLRWFVSFSVAVLYIPIISLLLIGLNCETVDGAQVLRKFIDSEQIYCFRGANLSIAIVSIFMIILFSIVAFCSSATYYEYDVNIKSRFAKPHSRFDITVLLVKTIFAFFFELLSHIPWLLAITFLLGMFWLTLGSIIVLPYNNQRLNQIKSGLYMAVFWVSLCTVITMGTNYGFDYDYNDVIDKSPATAYLVIVGIIPSFVAGFFASRFYYKWLTGKVEEIAFNNTTSISSEDVSPKTPGQKVTWDKQPQTLGSKRQLVFPFFSKKYVFSFFVEIMARKILKTCEGMTINSEAVEKANLLYQCGLQYFPNSDVLWMAYVNFLFTIRKDRHVGYAALEKLRRMKPAFDVRFFIYQRDKEREQLMDSDLRGPEHNGKIQDFVSYMEFKKLYYGAKRQHMKCLQYIKRFWSHLLHETVDLHKLSELSGRIATTENKANEQYERLLALNPNSVRVLRDYSQFLEEVVKDRDSSIMLQKKAESIEEAMSKSLSTDFKYSDIQTIDKEDANFNDEQPQANSIQMEKINDKNSHHGSSQDKSSDTSGSSKGRKGKYKEYQQSNSISKLTWLMIITTFLTIVFMIATLVVIRGMTVKHMQAFQGVVSFGSGGIESVMISINTNLMYASALGNDSAGVEFYREKIKRSNNILKNIHNAIIYGEESPQSYVDDIMSQWKARNGIPIMDVGSRVFEYSEFNKTNPITNKKFTALYNEPSFDIDLFVNPVHSGDNGTINPNYNTFVTQKYNAYKAVNVFVDNVNYVTNLTYADLQASFYNPHFKFVVRNGARGIVNMIQTAQNEYINALVDNTNSTSYTTLYIWLGIFAFLTIFAVALFRPIVSKISREKIRTLVLFSLAPRDLVIKMASRKIKMVSLDSGSDRDMMFETDEENDNLDDEAPRKHKDSRSQMKRSGTILVANKTDSDAEVNSDGPSILSSIQENGVVHRSERRRILASTGAADSGDEGSKDHSDKSPLLPKEESTTPATNSKGEQYGWDGKSKRNINKKSLRSILRRLHFSYSFALFILFGFITMGVFTSFTMMFQDVASGFDLAKCAERSVDSRLVSFYISELFLRQWDDSVSADLMDAITQMQQTHQSLIPIDDLRPLMDGTLGCWRLDQNNCITNETNEFFYDVTQGLDWTVDQFIKHSINLAHTDKADLVLGNPDLNWIQTVGGDYFFEGLERATFLYFHYWQEIQSWGIMVITTICSVTCVILFLIYMIFFRSFLKKLSIEHLHTLALLRLAPEDIQRMEVSDKVIDED
ncbi:hypothetical protein CYY_006059 [Polysphondylium violaceum]|uniref:TmcB/TmcC TPR repeats domain-containing protein n=1 Tax=Polysphondylium violaceum TaxID=133409 RepID=A0A8J4PSV6_9MYCE|nr:hypothetical protein CYY_006059 [Polysphondylium violaceum]